MENNNNSKKQQNFSRPFNTKNSQSADSKRKTDLQASKCAFPRVARRRDQQPPTTRSEQQRSSKQLPTKQRPNVDKRPRARGSAVGGAGTGGSYVSAYHEEREPANGNSDDSVYTAGAGLVEGYLDETGYDDNYVDDYVDFDDVHYKGRNSRASHLPSKRPNLNHLLNFRYVFRERADYLSGARGIASGLSAGGGGSVGGGKKHHQHKYNKEQFLQANFQFVIKSNVKPHLITSPDTIIDWSLIEQINIQTTEEPQCPICLYPPVAAKLTRCGHAYCWPCILHYLALNDKSWRKCPICYEAVHISDLKSTAILQQQPLNVGQAVSLQLMRRKKGSFFVEKFSNAQSATVERYPHYSGNSDMKPFSKFLIAKRGDILSIIERERAELLADDDTTCPEYVFVQQALNLLNERREKLGNFNLPTKCDEIDEDAADSAYEPCSPVYESTANNETFELNNKFEQDELVEQPACAAYADADVDVDAEAFAAAPASENSDIQTETVVSVDRDAYAQQKYYYFYQSVDGQNIFLHPLNVKMLQACYGALEFAPLTIDARIIQKECHTMDEELRRKFTCLGHLPLTCQFSIVELDLQAPIINVETLKLFKDDIKQRQLDRERRDREEKKRERKIAAINDRQMGKLIARTAKINLESAQEFPVCGFGFDLSPPAAILNTSATTSAKAAEKPTEVLTTINVPGTSPGPSYSSIITSHEISKVSNAGLFPELSLGAKSNRKVKHAEAVKPAIVSGNNRAQVAIEVLGSDCFDAPKRMGTNFGDVLEQAIARRKTGSDLSAIATPLEVAAASSGNTNNSTPNAGGKKQKREKKKMVPLFPSNASGGLYNFN